MIECTCKHCKPLKCSPFSKTYEQGKAENEAELKELREWKRDVEESHRRIMYEKCPTDEVHCTCVPALRRELEKAKALTQKVWELTREENCYHWDTKIESCQHPNCVEAECLMDSCPVVNGG